MSIWKTIIGQPEYRKEDFEGPRYARFNDRFFASALDTGLMFLLLAPLFEWSNAWVMGDVSISKVLAEAQQLGVAELAADHIANSGIVALMFQSSLLQFVIAGCVLIPFWVVFQSTPGKFLIGMKIVDVDTGEAPDFHQYFIRYAAFILSLTPFFIGFVWAAFTKKKRAWHDMLADTAVVYSRRKLSDWFAERHFAREERKAEMQKQREETSQQEDVPQEEKKKD